MHTHTFRMKNTQSFLHKAPGVYIQCVHYRTSLVWEWDCLKERKWERELVCIWAQMSVHVWATMCLRPSDFGLIWVGWAPLAAHVTTWCCHDDTGPPESPSFPRLHANNYGWWQTHINAFHFPFSSSNPNGKSVFISFQLTESTVIFQCFSGGGNYNTFQETNGPMITVPTWHTLSQYGTIVTEHERLFTLKTLQDDMEIYCRRKVKTDCMC